MFFNDDLAEMGVFNVEPEKGYKTPASSYLASIYKTGQGHLRLNLPLEMQIEENDVICLYSERITKSKFLRRNLLVLTETQAKNLSAEDRKRLHPRGVHSKGNASTYYTCLNAQVLHKPEGNWTHLRLHLTENPNLYYIEWVEIGKVEKEVVHGKEVETRTTFGNAGFEKPTINWD